jgi:hypothetical protein
MKKTSKIISNLAVALLLTASLAHAQSATGATTINVTVAAEAALTITTGTTNLTSTGTTFNNYTGTTNLTYFVRTTATGGNGSIKLQVTTDFSPAGGPSVATPPSAGDALAYTTSGTQPGSNGTATYYAASQNASTSAQTNVTAFSTDARSDKAGNSSSVAWTLTNDPKYKTGSYSATVTFTISAT